MRRILVCTGARGHVPVWYQECERLIRSHGEKHAIALKAAYRARLKVRHESELASAERFGLRYVCGNARNDLARATFLIEIDCEPHELIGFGYALGASYGTDFYFYFIQFVDRYARFIHGSCVKDSW